MAKISKLLPSRITLRSDFSSPKKMRASLDTDGKVFLFRIPEISISASGDSASDAYASLLQELSRVNELLGEGRDPVTKVAKIQRLQGLNHRLRVTSVIMLSLSLLIFAVSLIVVPLFDIRHALSSAGPRMVRESIKSVADKIAEIESDEKQELTDNIATIKEFLIDVSNAKKP